MFKQLWNLLFSTHEHEWEVVNKGVIYSDWNNARVGSYYDCRCTICGKMKVYNLK